jgi:hypothetical protein
MNFIDIYRYACEISSESVSVEALKKKIIREHPTVHEIIFFRCDLDVAISRGHMVLFLDRSSPHDEPYVVSSVRFSNSLNRCWRRFVCCKELMHLFDPSLSKTSNRAQFIELLNELENNPINVTASARFNSERYAEWQALFVLCPKNLRKKYKDLFDAKAISHSEIAQKLLIPEVYIRTILDMRYELYHEEIVGEPI